jgi:hypothetical protein
MIMHPTPAERLLSMLENESALEALPAGEVQDGLAALGIDPARALAFAKSLASGGATPGGQLMGALLAGEAEEEEIARIEAADIDEIHAQVHRGTAAAIVAEARRKAGADDKVVGLDARRRKRSRLIVWGGPLAGIAASLLVVTIFLGDRLLFQAHKDLADLGANQVAAPEPALPSLALEGRPEPSPDPPLADEMRALRAPSVLEPEKRAKEKTFADNSLTTGDEEALAFNAPAAVPPPVAEEKNVAPAESDERLGKQEQFAAAPPPAASIPARKPAPEDNKLATAPAAPVEALGESIGGGLAGAMIEAEADTAALPPDTRDAAAGLGRDIVISEIAAVLVLDPSQASLQVQSQILPPGELADRVDEAQRLAGERPVIALFTIATGDARRDFAQVPLQTGLSQQLAAPSPLVGLLGVEATEYDFIALPAE